MVISAGEGDLTGGPQNERSPAEIGEWLIAGGIRIATVLIDAAGHIVNWSPAAEDLTGYASADVVGRDIGVITSTSTALSGDEFLQRVRGQKAGVGQLHGADGRARSTEWRTQPMALPDGGQATLVLGFDSEELRTMGANLALLDSFFHQAPVGFVIFDTDLRYVALNDALARVNHRSVDDHLGRHIREVIDAAEIDDFERLLKKTLETGEPVQGLRLPGIPTSSPDTGQVWQLSWYRIDSYRGTPLGLCGMLFDVTHTEFAMLDAAKSRARLNLLSQASARMGSSLDLHDTAAALTALVTQDFCELASVDVLPPVGTGERLVLPKNGSSSPVENLAASSHLNEQKTTALLELLRTPRANDDDNFRDILFGDQPLLLHDLADKAAQEQFVRAQDALSLGVNSMIIAPLRARNTVLGMATFLRMTPRKPFDNDDLQFVNDLANRAALAIDNARLYLHQRSAALALQRALVPQYLPELSEMDVAFRYRPSSETSEVGGDWFDVISLPGRRVGIVVGDVMGHDINAAATMGRYRATVQSLAAVGLEPGLLLTRLSGLAKNFGDDSLATCVYVLYDPQNHRCSVASAGHPPPLFIDADGNAATLRLDSGPPLGAGITAEYHSTSVDTPVGSSMLLYSDGVVESRLTSVEQGIARLLSQAQGSGTVEEICDRILANLPIDGEDDVTVLLSRFQGLRR
ncbi:MAG: SpoIIE family protein phosphatase [Corynebacteriales bacterium]|nr:SpoIIE family protein phosphatase [Mycobacteriales bacterium]